MTHHEVHARLIDIITELDRRIPPERLLADEVSFAQRGLDSLTMIRLVVTLEEEFDIGISETEIYDASNMARLLDLVSAKLLDRSLAA